MLVGRKNSRLFSNFTELPFNDEDVTTLLERIVACNVEYPKNFSKTLKDLLQSLINPNPKKRFSSDDVMKHPWFLEYKIPL
jgi:serine/threonine protein kinase